MLDIKNENKQPLVVIIDYATKGCFYLQKIKQYIGILSQEIQTKSDIEAIDG